MSVSKLIYNGDLVMFTKELGVINSLDSITANVTSTLESNISSNLSLLYDRVDIKFRLNNNDKLYSDWYDLNEFYLSNTKTFSNVYVNSTSNSNVEIKYILLSTPNNWDEDSDYIEISNVNVTSTANISTLPTKVTPPALNTSSGVDKGLQYNSNFYYDPYAISEAERMNKEQSYQLNQIMGHEIEYVKVIPNNTKGKDVVLREWNLFNVKSTNIKCIKIIVPNNNFTESKFNFNPWGVSYPDFFEVQIDIRYFTEIFGDNTNPEEFDFLYIPIVNRMYEVSSVHIQRGVNMVPIYWSLTLNKYEKRSNVVFEDSTQKGKLDDKTKGLDDLFGIDVKEEADDAINKEQIRVNEVDLDLVRSFINSNLLFTGLELENNYTLFSNTQYDLNSLYRKFKPPHLAITYKNKFKVIKDSATTLTCWASFDKLVNQSLNCVVTNYSGSTYKVTLSTGAYHTDYTVDSYISLFKKQSIGKDYKYTMKITSINNDRDEILCTPYGLVNIDESDVDLVNLTIDRPIINSGTNTYNISTGIRSFIEDSDEGRFKIFLDDVYSINIDYFGYEYTFKLNEPLSYDNFYGFVVTFNLRYKQLGLYVYQVDSTNSSDNLILVDNFVVEQFLNVTNESTGVLNLLASPIKLTNIRLISEHIEENLHHGYMSRMYIDNASKTIIVDNAQQNIDLKDYNS